MTIDNMNITTTKIKKIKPHMQEYNPIMNQQFEPFQTRWSN